MQSRIKEIIATFTEPVNRDLTVVLDRAGAGVTGFETFMMSKVGRPMLSLVPWSLGLRLFETEGERILTAAAGRSAHALTTRALVPRQLAMEDSSRFWSAAMVARHLIVVGEKIARIMVTLGRGEMSYEAVNTADVKPDPSTPATAFAEYREFLTTFGRIMRKEIVNRHSQVPHPHPWTGPLTLHQWLNLATLHQRLHRTQLERILHKLDSVNE